MQELLGFSGPADDETADNADDDAAAGKKKTPKSLDAQQKQQQQQQQQQVTPPSLPEEGKPRSPSPPLESDDAGKRSASSFGRVRATLERWWKRVRRWWRSLVQMISRWTSGATAPASAGSGKRKQAKSGKPQK